MKKDFSNVDVKLINMNDVLAELGKVDADDLACVENAVSLIPSAVNNYFRKLNRKNDDENKKPKELEKKSEIKVVNIDKNNETPKGKEEEICPKKQKQNSGL